MDQIGPVEAPVVEDPPQRRAERRTQPPKPTSRAGRDLPAAVGVGVGLGAGSVRITLARAFTGTTEVTVPAASTVTSELIAAGRSIRCQPPEEESRA